VSSLRLRELTPQQYARDVLPQTAALWAGRRSFDDYAAQTLEQMRSRGGRRHYRTIGLYDGKQLVSSFKRYERNAYHGERLLRGAGFGAVFTPEAHRGRGYASLMIATALDAARGELDFGYLFSDIHPQFYAALGFHALPSRTFALRADGLPAERLELARFGDDEWEDVRRVFQSCTRRCAAAFARSALVWDWMAMRERQRSKHRVGGRANFVVRRRGRIVAYVFGARVPERDVFVLDEFGFAGDAAAQMVPALLRAAAGDLRRVSGWVPPGPLRAVLPTLRMRKRNDAMLMIAPLNSRGQSLVRTLTAPGFGDFCWPTDHI
jgi:GNAT superfamily N-acetyltransferase